MFKKMKQKLTMLLALLMALTMIPQGPIAAGNLDDYYDYYSEDVEPVDPAVFMEDLIDEAKSLGVPDAFYRHNLGTEYAEGNLLEPVTDLLDGEEAPTINMSMFTTNDGEDGLLINKIDTGVLARTKFDLGEYDFDDLDAGNLVYNMIAKKTLKGTAYLFWGDETDPFVSFKIKRCVNDDWEKTINKVVNVFNSGLSGKQHIYLKFIADSALDEDENIIPVSGVKGNLFLSSIFFTEGSTPVVDFSLDNEISTIDKVNGSELHTVMACGDMNINVPDDYKSEFTGKSVASGSYEMEYIRGRGNSTWLVDKKPYKIKLEKSSDLFGMGKSKHWVLLANYYDYSLIRNRMTFDLGRQMGMEYTPKSVSVDVIMDGEYYGSYQLSQHVRIGKGNIDIDDIEDLEPTEVPEITGGYLLSMGTSWLVEEDEEEIPWINTDEARFRIEKPEYSADYSEESKQAQIGYLNGYFADLESLIKATNDDDPDNDTIDGKTWRDYMDEQSYIDYYLFQEFSLNGDAYSSGSTYLYKKREGKVYWGPLWDFDFVAWAADSTNYLADSGAEGFGFGESNPWFTTLIKSDEEFKQHVIERWNVFKGYLEAAIADGGLLDQYKQQTYYSALANYQVRGSYLMGGQGYWGGGIDLVDDDGNPYTLNYTNEMERLKKFIRARIDWVDANIDTIDEQTGGYSVKDPVKFYVDDQVVAEVHEVEDGYRLIEDEIPADPVKEGLYFVGWFYIDEDGKEVKFSKDDWPYRYDDDIEEYVPCDVHAKFKKESEIVDVQDISFTRTRLYVPGDSYAVTGKSEEYFESTSIDLSEYLNIVPFDADYGEIKWFKKNESDPWEINSKGEVDITSFGEYVFCCQIGDKTASIEVNSFDYSDEVEVGIEDIRVGDTLELKEGEYGMLDYGFKKPKNVAYYAYDGFTFKPIDSQMVDVNNNGVVFAKKAGITQVLTIYPSGEDVDVKLTTIIIKGEEETTTAKDDSKKDEPKKEALKPGATFTDGTYNYKVTKSGTVDGKTAGNVSVIGLKNKSVKNIKIANRVVYDNIPYNVTQIANKAFYKNKKIKKATIGKNVTKIGSKAFYLANKLTKVTISSTKIKTIGKNAFRRKKCKKLTFKVKKSKKKSYKKKLKKAKTNKFKVK